VDMPDRREFSLPDIDLKNIEMFFRSMSGRENSRRSGMSTDDARRRMPSKKSKAIWFSS